MRTRSTNPGFLSFEHGIERFDPDVRLPATTLPEAGPASPSEIAPRRHLDELFQRPNLSQAIQEFLKPAIHDREALTPLSFRRNIDGLLNAFGHGSGRVCVDERISEAVGVLEQERDLRDLLTMYLSLLHRA